MFMTELELRCELDINFVNKFSVSCNLFLNMNILVRSYPVFRAFDVPSRATIFAFN